MNKSEEIIAEIKTLKETLSKLENSLRILDRDKLLPILRQHGRCEYLGGSFKTIAVVFDDPNIEHEFITYISSAADGRGFNHFGVKISEITSIRCDDNDISVCFDLSGKTSDINAKIKSELKALGLSLSFRHIKENAIKQVKNRQKELDQIIEMEKEYDTIFNVRRN